MNAFVIGFVDVNELIIMARVCDVLYIACLLIAECRSILFCFCFCLDFVQLLGIEDEVEASLWVVVFVNGMYD